MTTKGSSSSAASSASGDAKIKRVLPHATITGISISNPPVHPNLYQIAIPNSLNCTMFNKLRRIQYTLPCVASIRAGKAELDEEVVMLNILATISGRYFGQSEN